MDEGGKTLEDASTTDNRASKRAGSSKTGASVKTRFTGAFTVPRPPKGPQRFRPAVSTKPAAAVYTQYRESVELHVAGFFQIDPRTWIAEIHDGNTAPRERGVDAWTIVQCHASLTKGLSYTCAPCPDFSSGKTCVHTMLLEDANRPEFRPFSDRDDPECVCFQHSYPEGDENALSMFVLMDKSARPVLVSHYGAAGEAGWWTCTKDSVASCSHVAKAKTNPAFIHLSVRKGWRRWYEVVSEEDTSAEEDDEDLLQAAAERERADKNSMKELFDERSVSYNKVGPPAWSRLATDTTPSYKTADPLPERIKLGSTARCRCGGGGAGEIEEIEATIYGSTKAQAVTVEVQRCATCRPEVRQYAGPDPYSDGLFNYNNRRIYTHELLNKFTNSISAQETPFHAFCTVVRRSYVEAECEVEFVSDDAFRTAFFSFTRIQDLGDSFRCETCGDNPEVVIFDGVTAGFSNKHQTSTLCPPTLIMPNAPRRESVQTPGSSTALVWGKLRAAALKAVRWRLALRGGRSKVAGIGGEDSDEEDVEAADADANVTAAAKQSRKRVNKRDAKDAEMKSNLPKLVALLKKVNRSLAILFDVMVDSKYDREMDKLRKPYLELLEQVFAYESALLFVPPPTWLTLHQLLRGNVTAAEELLRLVPAIGTVARQELQIEGSYSEDLVGLVEFILERAMHVLGTLSNHSYEEATPRTDQGDWRETGVFYGRPQVRLRPEYPNLPGDQKVDRAVVSEDAAGGIGCNKFYETYGKRGQTGGLMAAWCPHCVCLGFHCIPKGEGRNDVFSALFTRWENPPKVVIYDFACALGPYCMVREPRFFKNTRFLIDGFHAKGHKRCTKSCFISSYKKNDPDLATVNSSAAECGNGGLLKIRRPLSYMTQRHAMLYSYTYLATWNRDRRLDIIRKAAKTTDPEKTTKAGETGAVVGGREVHDEVLSSNVLATPV